VADRTRRRSFRGELLDVRGAAELLGTSEKTIRARVARQLIPFRRLGSRIVFRRHELETFLDDLPGVSIEAARENLAMRPGEAVRR
jgi:excisionase family DNA binding protein